MSTAASTSGVLVMLPQAMRMRGSRTETSAMPPAVMTAMSLARKGRRRGARMSAAWNRRRQARTPSPGATAAIASSAAACERTASSGSTASAPSGIGSPASTAAAATSTAPAHMNWHRQQRLRQPQNRRAARSKPAAASTRSHPRPACGPAPRPKKGARRHRLDAGVDAGQNRIERRQARNALDAGMLTAIADYVKQQLSDIYDTHGTTPP